MNKLRKIDYWLVVPYLLLCSIGVVMVYSSSSNVAVQMGSTPIAYLFKQLFYVLIGIVILIFVTAMKTDVLRSGKLMGIGYIILLAILFYLLAKGQTINGAAGWIHIGPFSLQPAEFVKIFLILFVAKALTMPGQASDLIHGHWWQLMWLPLLMAAVLIGLVFIQPDMGSATIISAIVFIMCLSSGIKYKRSFAIFGAAVVFVVGIVFPIALKLSESGLVKSYKLARLVAFVDPFGHASTTGSQLVNSYYALSNGGLFGVGLGNSIQKRGFLPEPNTDFIMSIIGEELGLVGIIIILLLLGVMVWRMIKIGMRSDNPFYTLVCYGVATYFSVQAIINVGGVVGWLPITGVTFPFISYGGSSMFSLALSLGAVLNISAQERRKRES
ncbi:FtsW/RodA/SpoVE family cell cycle protein [Secundilactobacillus folii]|uniref:Probable peptidoglycan glycosyltransferase FtsW n=1 Tax=Secundilactobacillus folii TaxID=2678357 RepID=A0A7X3C2L0_9LACO|nr:FtsW/RodA/SpoVE family cell cycle protein [Secundilactobacillus folii]MTV81359.1 cell division protein FtsW [Secundilactobacillus folii]